MGTYQNNAEFYADFETVEKNAKNSLTKKLQAKKGAKLGIFLNSSFILLIYKSFLQITFSGCTFFNYFHGFEISVKFCVFWILVSKKRI